MFSLFLLHFTWIYHYLDLGARVQSKNIIPMFQIGFVEAMDCRFELQAVL